MIATLKKILPFVITFVCGAAYEMGCVFWVHFSEHNDVIGAVLFSMFNAIVTVIGTEQYLKNFPLKVIFVLGFGTGTALAILLKIKVM